jgi:hypothetical protein
MDQGASEQDARPSDREEKLRKVEALMKLRECRNRLFGINLFSDPAWEIMLRLFAAHLQGSSMRTVDLVGVISSVPTSSLLRFLSALEHDRRIFWIKGDQDGVVQLTLDSLAAMHALFEIVPGERLL